jgi:radical SAM superfamily enzyme YgiQ (UPF0313 family)
VGTAAGPGAAAGRRADDGRLAPRPGSSGGAPGRPGAGSLRAPGAILLVSCYELGRQPLALASPLAHLRRAGFDPAALDLATSRLDPDLVRRARLVAISVPMHTALRIGARALERVRALHPGTHICLYGLYAVLNADLLLERGADSIIGGEYEEPLAGLARGLDAGSGGAAPGVGVRAAPAGPWIRKIDFAIPERDDLPDLGRYARLERDGTTRTAGHVEASRGCLHRCRHCPIPPVYGGRFFVVPRGVVLADIDNQVAAGAAHITFGDPDFLNGPKHSLAIVRAMRARHPGLTFDCTAKIEHLLEHRRVLPELARLGCLFIVSAVESLSDRVLAILDKGHTRAGVEEALRLTEDAGIALRPSLVPFTPWTTLDDYLGLLEFIDTHDLIDRLDPIQLGIRLLIPRGSLLFEHPEMRPHLGPFDPQRFTWAWTHPDPRMDRLHAEVAALLETSAERGDPPEATVAAVAARAAAAAGRPAAGSSIATGRPPPARRDKGRAPRLTEPWFC